MKHVIIIATLLVSAACMAQPNCKQSTLKPKEVFANFKPQQFKINQGL